MYGRADEETVSGEYRIEYVDKIRGGKRICLVAKDGRRMMQLDFPLNAKKGSTVKIPFFGGGPDAAMKVEPFEKD